MLNIEHSGGHSDPDASGGCLRRGFAALLGIPEGMLAWIPDFVNMRDMKRICDHFDLTIQGSGQIDILSSEILLVLYQIEPGYSHCVCTNDLSILDGKIIEYVVKK